MASKSETRIETEPVFCARCAAELQAGMGNFYHITIDAVADPAPPVITEEMMKDVHQQIEQLIAHLDDLSAQEAMDQVHRRLTLHLCGPCYRVWIENPTG